MADQRYAPGIIAGCAKSLSPGQWPESVPELGEMVGGRPYARCVDCKPNAHPMWAGTHVQYGGKPLCKLHARKRAQRAE